MKITINDTRGFVQDLKLAFAATCGRYSNTVLQHVKLSVNAEHSEALLQSTDTGLSIRIDVWDVIYVHDAGECLLPKAVMQILESGKDSEWTFESNVSKKDRKIILTGSNGERAEFAMDDPDDFPDVESPFGQSIDVDSDDMQMLINRTVFATDKTNVKYALSGVCFAAAAGKLDAAATDGRRLGWQQIKYAGMTDEEPNVIIPEAALKMLAKICKRKAIGGRTTVSIRYENDRITFERENVLLVTKLVEGRFPKWRDIIPQETRVFATVNVDDLLTAVNKVAPLVKNSYEPGVILNFDHNGIMIEAKNDQRQSLASCSATCNGTARLKIDPKYLESMLKSLDKNATLSVYLQEDNSPAMIKTNDGYTYVVMPMSGCNDAHVKYEESAAAESIAPDDIPEAVTGTDDSGNVSTPEKHMKKTRKKTKPAPAAACNDVTESANADFVNSESVNAELRTQIIRLTAENDQLQAKADHYKALLDRAMRVIRKNRVFALPE